MCLREVSIMKGVHHPCILECKESFVHGSNIFIVMPHCTGGDLYSLLARQRKKKRRLPEEVVVDWFAQILLGVEHLHSHNTLHRTRKPKYIPQARPPGAGGQGAGVGVESLWEILASPGSFNPTRSRRRRSSAPRSSCPPRC